MLTCFTEYVGVYQNNYKKIRLPFLIYLLSFIPFTFSIINLFYSKIVYLRNGLITIYPEISTDLFLPVIFSIKIKDKFGNQVEVKEFFNRYNYSVPLNLIIFNESLIGEKLDIQIFRNNELKVICIDLNNTNDDAFGNILQQRINLIEERELKKNKKTLDEQYDFC